MGVIARLVVSRGLPRKVTTRRCRNLPSPMPRDSQSVQISKSEERAPGQDGVGGQRNWPEEHEVGETVLNSKVGSHRKGGSHRKVGSRRRRQPPCQFYQYDGSGSVQLVGRHRDGRPHRGRQAPKRSASPWSAGTEMVGPTVSGMSRDGRPHRVHSNVRQPPRGWQLPQGRQSPRWSATTDGRQPPRWSVAA